tara:strand:- start:4966 stop:5727 length:762 start_codon:yes stop_codon:yes gene_type:complete
MLINKQLRGAGSVAKYCYQRSIRNTPWKLRWAPVCSSTEINLSKWLDSNPVLGSQPRAFIAGRQKHGKGQRGRLWKSPQGGVWLSAALPIYGSKNSVGLFGLAVALSVAERLEAKQIPVKIKWPNDLLVFDQKLAGFLPRLIYRGESLKFARVGIGMNIRNKVPPGGISLAEILGTKNCYPAEWTAEVLLALEKVINLLENNESIYLEAEKRLWDNKVIDPKSGELLDIEGLDIRGALKLRKGNKTIIWNRWE